MKAAAVADLQRRRNCGSGAAMAGRGSGMAEMTAVAENNRNCGGRQQSTKYGRQQ